MGNLITQDPKLLADLDQKGFTLFPKVFDASYINDINGQIDRYAQMDHPGIIKEADAVTVRGIHGPHLYDGFFKDIAEHPQIVALAEKVLGEAVYLHQFKVNMKHRMNGQAWPWHEDYVYWAEKDGIETPNLINIAILLDQTDMLSGPLCFIPNSHNRSNTYEVEDESKVADWRNDLSADLNYKIDSDVIAQMIADWGTEYAIGTPGDLLVFNPLTAHCSASNLSPHDRRLLILTYNAVSNAPKKPMGRPEFLCGIYNPA